MLHTNDDKKQLIQSMKKLTLHVSNNQIRQKQIFSSITKIDLMKIVNNLNDQNEYLRRISALLLCELLYNNEEIKQKVTKMLQIMPDQGRICLSTLPEAIHRYPSTIKKCIELMKLPFIRGEQDKMCWTINLDRKSLKLEHLDYKKYSSFTFLDPARNIFGFTIKPKSDTKIKLYNVIADHEARTRDSIREPARQRSIDSQKNSQRSFNGGNPNSFYKNYIQARNRSKESRAEQPVNVIRIDSSVEQKRQNSYTRPIANKLITTTNIAHLRQSKRQDLNESTDKSHKINTIQSISQYARNSYSNNYVKRPRMSEALNSTQLKFRNRDDSKEANNSYMLTDRKNQSYHYNRLTLDGDSIISEKDRLPESARHSYTSSHQNFYKRVKQILKR